MDNLGSDHTPILGKSECNQSSSTGILMVSHHDSTDYLQGRVALVGVRSNFAELNLCFRSNDFLRESVQNKAILHQYHISEIVLIYVLGSAA